MTSVARLDVENLPQQGRSCQPVTHVGPRYDWSMRLLASDLATPLWRYHGRTSKALSARDRSELASACHCGVASSPA